MNHYPDETTTNLRRPVWSPDALISKKYLVSC